MGGPADRCSLFRSASTWTLVTIRRSVDYDGCDQPSGGKATITTGEFPNRGAGRENLRVPCSRR